MMSLSPAIAVSDTIWPVILARLGFSCKMGGLRLSIIDKLKAGLKKKTQWCCGGGAGATHKLRRRLKMTQSNWFALVYLTPLPSEKGNYIYSAMNC